MARTSSKGVPQITVSAEPTHWCWLQTHGMMLRSGWVSKPGSSPCLTWVMLSPHTYWGGSGLPPLLAQRPPEGHPCLSGIKYSWHGHGYSKRHLWSMEGPEAHPGGEQPGRGGAG